MVVLKTSAVWGGRRNLLLPDGDEWKLPMRRCAQRRGFDSEARAPPSRDARRRGQSCRRRARAGRPLRGICGCWERSSTAVPTRCTASFLSCVFFAGEFGEELIQLGQADARPWIDEHPADPWQLDPLSAWNQPPAATETPSAHHTDREYVRSRPRKSSHPPSPGKQRRRLSNVAAPAAGDTCRLPRPGRNLREVGLPEALAPGARTARGNARSSAVSSLAQHQERGGDGSGPLRRSLLEG